MENYNCCCIESEESLLGNILFDPKCFDRIANLLNEKLFFLSKHRTIYQAILKVVNNKQEPNLVNVSTYLAETNELSKVGGMPGLSKLSSLSFIRTNTEDFIKTLWRKLQLREAIAVGNELVTKASNPRGENPNQIFDWLQDKLAGFQNNETKLLAPREFVDINSDAIDALNSGSAIKSELNDLDDVMSGGFDRGTLTIIGALPSIGKTAFVCNLARRIGTKLPTLLFSLEMTANQLVYRLWSQYSREPEFKNQGIQPIEADRIRRHRADEPLAEAELSNIFNLVGLISDYPLYLIDDVYDIETVKAKVMAIKEKHSELGGILIDYLQIFDGGGDSASERSSFLGKVSRKLLRLAQDINCPIFACSQVKEKVTDRNDKRPGMHDLANSSQISHVASNIITLHREDFFNPDCAGKNILEVIVCKSRNGKVGTAKSYFDRQYGYIGDLHKPMMA